MMDDVARFPRFEPRPGAVGSMDLIAADAADAAEVQYQRARLLIGALVRAGVRCAVTSPGSRSTPLVLAALDASNAGSGTAAASAGRAALDLESIIDERAAAFFALGQARATGMPTALVCTSGSAPGHYLPAILEAREAGLPLIVLSADRPAELMDCAAPQTTDQTKLFGSAVNHFAEVDLRGPTDSLSLRALRRAATQAVFRSRWPRGGAVHLNARARKPLERPTVALGSSGSALAAAVDALLDEPLAVAAPSAVPDPNLLDQAAELCRKAERGLIFAGLLPLPPPEARREAADVFGLGELARRTGFPLLAEATSQSRFVGADAACGSGHLADGLGAAWAASGGQALPAPDLVLHVGAPPVSAGALRLIETSGAARITLSDGPWTDPAGTTSLFLTGDVEAAVRGIASRLAAPAERPAGEGWRRGALACSRAFRQAVSTLRVDSRNGGWGGGFHDGDAARAAVAAVPTGGLLMLGNSLPVRLVESWVGRVERRIWVAGQRGLSGIDGLVAGFLGSLSAGGFPAGALLLGDVSLLHDLDGLAAASAHGDGPPAVIVVIDNGGGRIFDRLPIASTEVFRGPAARHWLTPREVDFAGLAQAFGLAYAEARDLPAAEREIAAAVARRGASLVVARSSADALGQAETALRQALASAPPGQG